ncbi:MAG: hypothetical protein K2N84_07525 [Clostridia bacterium]|nr:hypothetical protein [Clostridia bacterium]
MPDFFVIGAETDISVDGFSEELNRRASAIGGGNFAVRSSGVSEDGEEASFAGQYHTELNVPLDGLFVAVQKVLTSAEGQSISSYSKHAGFSFCKTAVVVQRQISGIVSGVMFSTSLFEKDEILIESVEGCGEQLVGGIKTPRTLRFKKGARAEGYLNELLNAAQVLERAEGCPVDVEWTYDGEKLWFLQLRKQTVLSDEIPQIPQRKWNMYVYRDFTVFSHSVQARATESELQTQLYGFSVPVEEGLLVCGREFYSEENDLEINLVWERLDKGNFFYRFLDNIEKSVRRTRARTAAVAQTDYSGYSQKRLISAYRREISAYIDSYVPMMMRPDDYLYNKLTALVGEKRAQEIVEAVSALIPKTYYSDEHRNFLKAVASGNSAEYISKYEWKNNPLGKQFEIVTEREFKTRSHGLSPLQAQENLNALSVKKRGEKSRARKVFAGLCGEEKTLADLILRFIYYRTRTAENSDRYFFYIRKNLLSEIAVRFGLDDKTLLLYRADEVEELLVSGKALKKSEMAKRKNGDAIIFLNGKHQMYFGGSSFSLLKELLPDESVKGAVRGEIACAGCVTGRVKVVSCFADAENAENDCIIVSSMITPDLTLALEKAAGIITDEGGITCHAAIIAREYAVPCLVGTQIATRCLKDGMMVKLDCIEGCFSVIDNTEL